MRPFRVPLPVLLLLCAVAARASNTGFGLSVHLSGGDPASFRTDLVSLPYFYFPNGRIEPQFAHDLVHDFPSATGFSRVDPDTGTIESWDLLGGVWMGEDFPLAEAVGVAVTVPWSTSASVTGSHDNAFPGRVLHVRPGGGPTPHLVAPPYHTTWMAADDVLAASFDGFNPLTLTAYRNGQVLSRSVTEGPVYDGDNFALVLGEALELTIEAETSFLSPYYLGSTGGGGGTSPDPIVVGVTRFAELNHTEGGPVLDAADGTRADGATWRAASALGNDAVATSGNAGQGMVGARVEGVWYGQVGVGLNRASGGAYRLRVGDDRLVLVDKMMDEGRTWERGYYGVVNRDITSKHPDLFPSMQLRPVPVPTVRAVPGGVLLRWAEAVEDPGNPQRRNVIGYEVLRSTDAGDLQPIAVVEAPARQYLDGEASKLAPRQYALRLVYRFGLRSLAWSARSHAVEVTRGLTSRGGAGSPAVGVGTATSERTTPRPRSIP